MQTASVVLLANASATGTGKQWPGGRGVFTADGTFDGATVSLQVQGPAGTWFDAGAGTSLTAANAGVFELGPAMIRAAVTGGSAPTGLYANAERVPA